ncbi:hypothetical protein [Chitinophaga sp. LS1]|uniref:hypothetical protein n=1 Tax=Chitinophaga sp. LS1 TaxID=3051176 RepID=UPI002AABD606|nr:hypothetical protein [Chitinophaga sp. LS1]WPV67043.1 hypothetical protein QQL36_35210 [Chitinophaga sp. LS1]
MSEKLKDFFQSLGLGYKHPDAGADLPSGTYQNQNDQVEKLKTHRDFLKGLEEEEQNRLDSIDTKGSQLISQVGIIFALLSLFIPFIMDKTASFHVTYKVLLIILLIFSALFYVLSIHNALKNYRLSDFQYVRPSAQNVIDFKDKSEAEFLAEEIRDYLSGKTRNVHNNNKKGTNLLHAYVAFKYANVLTGLLIACFAIAMVFYKPEKNSVSIEGPVVIKDLRSINGELKQLGKKKDTTIVNVQITVPEKKEKNSFR